MLIDNDERYVKILGYLFELEGFNVDIAYSGETVRRIFIQRPYPLILTDYGLNDTKGDELAREIRQKHPNSHIILNTGFKKAIDPSKLEVFDAVFEKNMNPNIIVKTIVKLFEKLVETNVPFTPPVLDPELHEVVGHETQDNRQKPSPETLVDEVKKLDVSKSSKKPKRKSRKKRTTDSPQPAK